MYDKNQNVQIKFDLIENKNGGLAWTRVYRYFRISRLNRFECTLPKQKSPVSAVIEPPIIIHFLHLPQTKQGSILHREAALLFVIHKPRYLKYPTT